MQSKKKRDNAIRDLEAAAKLAKENASGELPPDAYEAEASSDMLGGKDEDGAFPAVFRGQGVGRLSC